MLVSDTILYQAEPKPSIRTIHVHTRTKEHWPISDGIKHTVTTYYPDGRVTVQLGSKVIKEYHAT